MPAAAALFVVLVVLVLVARADASGQGGPGAWLADLAERFSGPSVDANTAAFLRMLRDAEFQGLVNDDAARYHYIFGGQAFDSFADHPRVRVPFRETTGAQNYTTAAGGYQFTIKTWDRLAAKLDLADFSPANQDLAALELLRENGALELVQSGDFEGALNSVNKIWASLPGAPYPQKQRSLAFVHERYETAGGTYEPVA